MSHSAERRLTHRTPRNISTVSERFIDALRHPEDEGKMAQVLVETREAGGEDALREALKNRWESLDAQERGMIWSNIERRRDRTEQQSDTRREFLELVRQMHVPERVQATPEPERVELTTAEAEVSPRARSAAPETVPETAEPMATAQNPESLLESVGTGMEKMAEKMLPKRWTERMSRNQKIATVAAATAGLAAAGVLLWKGVRRLMGWGKSAHEEASEVAKKSGSWWKKILVYGAVGTAAFFGIRWLANYIIDKTIDKYKIRWPQWLDNLGIGPDKGGLIGTRTGPDGKRKFTGLLDRDRNDPWIPDTVETPVKTLAEAGLRSTENAMELFGNIYENVKDSPVMEIFRKRETYTTNVDYTIALANALRQSGWEFVVAENGIFASTTGKMLKLEGDLFGEMWHCFESGEWKWDDLFVTYIEGAIFYATSVTALRAITLFKYGKGAVSLWNAGLWPYYAVKYTVVKPVAGAGRAAQFGIDLIEHGSHARLSASRVREGMKLKGLQVKSLFSRSQNGLAIRGALVRRLMVLEEAAGMGKNHPNYVEFAEAQKRAIQHFRKYIKKMKPSEIPTWFKRAHQQVAPNVPIGTLDDGNFYEILKKSNPIARKKAVGGTSAATNAAPAVRPRSGTSAAARSRPSASNTPPPPRGAAAAGAGPELAPQTMPRTTTPQPTVPEGWNVVGRDGVRRPANNLASAAREALPTDTKLAKLLQQIDGVKKAGNNKELARLLRDPLLDQAAKQGDEAAQALVTARNAVSRGRWIGRGLIGLGVAIDLAFIGYNEYRIQNALEEGENQLADILRAKRKTLVASGFSSVPLTVATTSFAASSTPLITLGVATAPAWATGIVLAAPVAVGAAYAESIYSNLEEWNAKERDYAGLQGGNILHQIHEWETRRDSAHYAAGHRDSNAMALWRWSTAWTQAAKERRNQHYIRQHQEADTAINQPQRMKLYSAYFLRYSTVSLSATDWESVEKRMKALLDSDHSRGDKPSASPKIYEEKEAFQNALQHVLGQKQQHMLQAKIAYIQHRSRGNMRLLPPDELERADTYQELLNMKAEMERTGRRPMLQYIQEDGSEHTISLTDVNPGNWQQTDYVISEYMNEYKPRMEFMTAIRDLEMARSEDRNRVEENIRESIVRAAVHHLNRAEQRVTESKLSNMHKMALRQALRLKFETQVDQVLAILNDPESTVQQYKEGRNLLMHIAEHARDAEKTLQQSHAPLAVLLRKQYQVSPGMYQTERIGVLRHGDMQKEQARMLQEEGIEAETALSQLAEKANPLVQNMIETAIADLELHRKPGTNIYKKEGHAGDYIPRPDGSIYYTGGRALNGNKLPPKRYMNGKWYWE